MTKPEIAWDLSVVFPSVTDPSIEKAIEFIQKAADDLVTNYQGKIINFSSKELLGLLEDYEKYLVETRNLGMFARLTFAANMTVPESQQLNDRVSKLLANLSVLGYNKRRVYYRDRAGDVSYCA